MCDRTGGEEERGLNKRETRGKRRVIVVTVEGGKGVKVLNTGGGRGVGAGRAEQHAQVLEVLL